LPLIVEFPYIVVDGERHHANPQPAIRNREMTMNYDTNKIDDLVLALLHLTSSSNEGIVRAWKGHDWDALDRLHEKV